MDFAGLGYGYCLTCISILLPIIVAGYVSTVAYTFFEKNNSAEIATKNLSYVRLQLGLFYRQYRVY